MAALRGLWLWLCWDFLGHRRADMEPNGEGRGCRQNKCVRAWQRNAVVHCCHVPFSFRPLPLYLVSCLEQALFPHSESLARNIQDYLGAAAQDPSS